MNNGPCLRFVLVSIFFQLKNHTKIQICCSQRCIKHSFKNHANTLTNKTLPKRLIEKHPIYASQDVQTLRSPSSVLFFVAFSYTPLLFQKKKERKVNQQTSPKRLIEKHPMLLNTYKLLVLHHPFFPSSRLATHPFFPKNKKKEKSTNRKLLANTKFPNA